jgi:PAS domain S-box-containing protein
VADVERLGSAPRDVLAALLEAVADAVYLVDPDGRVVFANPAALRLLGYAEEELLGRVSHPTIHHSHWDGSHFPQDECPMLRPRLTGETVRVYGDCFWRKDGSKFRVAYSSAPLMMASGRGAVVVFRDVTTRMEGEEAARREAVERARAAEIHASRARIVAAADEERRRLGRDLHDGAQQRLVRVLLALRLAERGADADTRALLDAAAVEADAAITELRELGAGIHPQILTNRGLAAAVESLTGPLPLLVEATIPEARYPAGVEAAAYFVVAEALTNVLKHAQATAASVTVREDGTRLVVEVSDDGRGGVDLDRGSGLRGLADRVAALDGTFSVLGGGGTTIRAALPL